MKSRVLILILVVTAYTNIFAQDEDTRDETLRSHPRKSKFLTGLYVASYFANKHSASTYNGYGFDIDGNRNPFENSFMHQKIINEYGGGYGQHDYIADAIGVDQRQWTFNESDMPFNMHYIPAIVIGVNFRIPVARKSSLIINVNGTKLNVEGNFTLGTIKPNNPNPLVNTNVQTHVIKGGEQRLFFQAGFQQLFGANDAFNFLLEGGVAGTLSKFDRNYVLINDLKIDLTYYVNQTLYPAPYPTKNPVGFGLGAFAGMGANIDAEKFNVQFVYTPSFEKINIGTDPKHKLQHALGIRFYYKFLKMKAPDS